MDNDDFTERAIPSLPQQRDFHQHAPTDDYDTAAHLLARRFPEQDTRRAQPEN